MHCHLLLLDGVYRDQASGPLVFQQAPPLRAPEWAELVTNIHRRFTTLLRRRGLLQEVDGNLPEQLDVLGMCANQALSAGRRERQGPALSDVIEDDVERPSGGVTASVQGMNGYASPVIDGGDRATLEKVCGYLLRGPIALSRLRERDDGMLTYRLKKPDRRGNTVLVLSPRELLMRLASLIPAPRHPTRRYFGILAAGSRRRRLVVPKPTHRRRPRCDAGEPPLPTQSPVKWALLLKRVWGLDSLACPKCHATMRAMAVLEDPAEIARFLAHLGQTTLYPRSRAPPDLAA